MNNAITIVGRVGQEPKAKNFDDTGNKVVKFSVAVKDYTAKDEEEKKLSMWFDVDAWNGLGDRVMEHVTKGREVVINGRMMLTTFKKDVNGVTVDWPKAYIKMSGFHLCGSKPDAEKQK